MPGHEIQLAGEVAGEQPATTLADTINFLKGVEAFLEEMDRTDRAMEAIRYGTARTASMIGVAAAAVRLPRVIR